MTISKFAPGFGGFQVIMRQQSTFGNMKAQSAGDFIRELVAPFCVLHRGGWHSSDFNAATGFARLAARQREHALPTSRGAGRPPPSKSDNGALVVGLVVLCLLAWAIGQCSGSASEPREAGSEAAAEAIASGVASQVPQPVLAVDRASVKLAIKRLALAARSEGVSGEMIYSQNCYDALTRQFSWAKLDACGAFDHAAVQAFGDAAVVASGPEADWFESEALAGRYLKAAIAAGEDPGKADVRLSDLQAMVRSYAVVAPQATAPVAQASAQDTDTRE